MRIQLSRRRVLEGLGVNTEHDLYKTIRNIKVCTDFRVLEVKVPINFFRHVGFSTTQGWTLP
jgi:hypothetical protein